MSETPTVSEEVASVDSIDTSSPSEGAPQEAPQAETEAASSSNEGVTTEAAVGTQEAAADRPVLPEFDFETWEGQVDSLPEEYRPIGSYFENRYSSQIEDFNTKLSGANAELDQLRQLNDALLIGGEDPRIAQYQGEIESYKDKYSKLEEEYKQYQNHIDSMFENDAKKYADAFRAKNEEFFENEEKAAQLVALIEQDWDPEQAVQLLKLGEQAMEVAKKAKSDGVPDSYAIRLAETAVRRPAPAAPRPGAKITSGATASSTPNQEKMSLNDSSTLDDRRLIVARRAIKQAQGR